MSLKLVDTHAHLDAFIKNGSVEEVLNRARLAGVERIICCSTKPDDWRSYLELVRKYPDIISWQVGVHPSDVEENSIDSLDALSSYFIGDFAPVAVGEVGMDFYWLPKDPEEIEKVKIQQEAVFRRQLNFARDLDVPICVHARNAFRECIDIMRDERVDFSKVVFHCFSGTVDEVKELNSLGGRASFTGIITYKSADEMREAMLAQGLDYLMLETDCPYLAPVPLRGSKCEPAMLVHTAKMAADVFACDVEKIAEITTRNAREFFGF